MQPDQTVHKQVLGILRDVGEGQRRVTDPSIASIGTTAPRVCLDGPETHEVDGWTFNVTWSTNSWAWIGSIVGPAGQRLGDEDFRRSDQGLDQSIPHPPFPLDEILDTDPALHSRIVWTFAKASGIALCDFLRERFSHFATSMTFRDDPKRWCLLSELSDDLCRLYLSSNDPREARSKAIHRIKHFFEQTSFPNWLRAERENHLEQRVAATLSALRRAPSLIVEEESAYRAMLPR